MVPRRERSHPSARRFDASSPLVTQGPMECPRWKLLCRQEPDRCRLTQYSMMAECRQSTQHLLKVECRSSSSTDGLSGISDGQGQRPFSSSALPVEVPASDSVVSPYIKETDTDKKKVNNS